MRAFLSFALALPLVACGGSSDPQTNDHIVAAPSPTPGTAPSPVATDARVVPQPGALRTFGDWTVGCDNGGTCQAGALMGEDAPMPPISFTLERAAGPDGAIELRLRHDTAPALPLTAIVDDEPVVRGGRTTGDTTVLTGTPAATLARRIATGRALRIADAGGQTVGAISLDGAAAALRWIDARQGRADTVGALVARGARADDRPAPALPLVRAATIRGEAALLDPQLVTTMRRTAACGDHDLPDPTTTPLGGGRTLALVPCMMGAYNLLSAVFVVENGKATPAAFDAKPAMEGDAPGVPMVVNGDIADGVLSSDAKGRGLGDCGIRQRFAWDGTGFRLIEQREMEECRGNIDFIRTWTARIAR